MSQQQIQRFLLAFAIMFSYGTHHLSNASSNSTHTGMALALADKAKNTKKTREALSQRLITMVEHKDVGNVLACQNTFGKLLAADRKKHEALNTYNGYKQAIDYNTFAAIIAGLNLNIGTRGITTIIKQYCRSIANSPYQQAICVARPIATNFPKQWRKRDSLVSPNSEFLVQGIATTEEDESSRKPILIRQTDTLKQQAFDVDVQHSGPCVVDGLWAPNSKSIVLLPHSYLSFSPGRMDPICMVHVTPAFSEIKGVSVAAHYVQDVTQWSWSPDSLLLAVPEAPGILKNRKRAINLITRQGAIQQQLVCNPVCGQVMCVVLPLAWSANNRYLAAACSVPGKNSTVVYIFNVATGALEKEIAYDYHAACMAWAEQDSVLAIANSEGDIDIYNAQTKEQYCANIVDRKGINYSRWVLQWHDMCLYITDDSGSAQVHELQPVCSVLTGNTLLLESTYTDELFNQIIDINCARRVLGLVGKSSDTI